MKRIIAVFLAGLIFGLGLVVSQMIDPAKILGFLDVAGNWDPSLALVMGGAVPVAALGFRLAARLQQPLVDLHFRPPVQSQVDRRLVLGAALFGIGWGLVGYCPGPALTSLAMGREETLIFVLAMLAGMGAHQIFERPSARPRSGSVKAA